MAWRWAGSLSDKWFGIGSALLRLIRPASGGHPRSRDLGDPITVFELRPSSPAFSVDFRPPTIEKFLRRWALRETYQFHASRHNSHLGNRK
jgi:hypothetical protein